MKTGQKFIRKVFVALLSAVLIATMLPFTVLAANDGNTYGTAYKVEFDKKYTGSLKENDRIDWYKIVLPESGLLKIKAQAGIESVCYYLYSGEDASTVVYDHNRYTGYQWDSVSEMSNNTFNIRLAAGTYYFRVSVYEYLTQGPYYGNYNITASFESAGESFKETIGGINNKMSEASSIKLNTFYKAQLCNNDEKDYYKFVLPADTDIEIISTYYDMFYLNYYLYDEDGSRVYSNRFSCNISTASGDVGEVSIKKSLKKGTYYFAVIRDGNYAGTYNFKIKCNVATPTPTKKPTATPTPKATPKSIWKQEGNNWYYYNAKGAKVKGWQQIGSVWYFFDSKGVMQTGWVQDGGKWYYMSASGAMATGWVQDGGKWYYMSASGAMATGWVQDGGKWYYMSASGAMATGWIKDGGKWYFMSASGAMATGWVKSGTVWYYMDPSSGAMVSGTSRTINGKKYNFDSTGKCTNP